MFRNAQPELAGEVIFESPEDHWKAFMVSILANTSELCCWLAVQANGRCKDRTPRTLKRRLLNAAVAWNWVYGSPNCELKFEEVCLHLGISEDRVRSRILAAAKPRGDINQVVVRILDECEDINGDPKRKAAHPCRVGALDWARLRDFRRNNPLGACIEDFRRLALGFPEDRDADRRRGGGASRGRAKEQGGAGPV